MAQTDNADVPRISVTESPKPSCLQVARQQLLVARRVQSASRRAAVVVHAASGDGRPTILVAEPLGEAGAY